MTKTDLLIIGSGPGGYRTAEYAANNGLKVIIIEKNEAGGTCLNCGCIPTKTFCHYADIVEAQRQESEILGSKESAINFGAIAERKRQVVEQLRNGVEALMSAPGITFIKGEAKFKDSKTVIVGEEEYTADNIIIATGSHSKMPPVEMPQSPRLMTSTELLDINYIPKRLCIIGAGVIGMEFASAFASFGSEVTVVEFLKECLPTLDSDIAKRLRKTIEKRDVNFYLQSAVKSISENGDSLKITFDKKGKEQEIEADVVLIATGRAANVEGLELENAGINVSRIGIDVNDDMQTNVDNVYAIGDVNARMMLAHAATFQGLRVVNKILGKKDTIRLDIMPSAIFTNPEAASVGLTEDQCKEQGIDFICKKGYYRSNGKALAMNETEGMVKLLSNADGKILGCHIYGSHASDLVQEVAAMMNTDATVYQLRDTVHTHPTLEEILQTTAEQF